MLVLEYDVAHENVPVVESGEPPTENVMSSDDEE